MVNGPPPLTSTTNRITDSPEVSVFTDEQAREIDGRVRRELERHASGWKTRLKFASLGFAVFAAALPLGADDVVRALHEAAFPETSATIDDGVPSISFGSGIELRVGDPTSQTRFMSFYAKTGQRVQLYLTLTPRLLEGDNPPEVVISVNGKPVGRPIRTWVGGFKDITKTLEIEDEGPLFDREQTVHQLGFSLSDINRSSRGEVAVSAIVLVF